MHPGGRCSFPPPCAGVGCYPWLWVAALGVSLLALRHMALRVPCSVGFCRLPRLACDGGYWLPSWSKTQNSLGCLNPSPCRDSMKCIESAESMDSHGRQNGTNLHDQHQRFSTYKCLTKHDRTHTCLVKYIMSGSLGPVFMMSSLTVGLDGRA